MSNHQIINQIYSEKMGVFIQTETDVNFSAGVQMTQEPDPLVPGRLRAIPLFGIVINGKFISTKLKEEKTLEFVNNVIKKYKEELERKIRWIEGQNLSNGSVTIFIEIDLDQILEDLDK